MKKVQLMSICILVTATCLAGEATHEVSPHTKLKDAGFGHTRWTQGFWADRFQVCSDSMVPNMWRLLEDPEISHAYANFLAAAGKIEDRHRGPKWHDGDFYKWLEAAAYVYGITRDETLNRQMDEIIAVIGASQRNDGYIHSPVVIAMRSEVAKAGEFANRLDFETYNMGHLMTCACVHYQATGKTTLLEIARKAADYLYSVYKTDPQNLANNAICPSHYMAAADFYRITGDARYREMLVGLVEIRELVKNGTDDNQDRIPFYEQRTAVGHAVRANYLYAGAADILAETGDPRLRTALDRIWQDVVSTKLSITCGAGALYNGSSPDGAKKQDAIQPIHQAYGRPYQLPNITAHNESCATVGLILWSRRMLLLTSEARYADVMEQAFYNGLLASISLDGTKFLYTNALRVTEDLPFELRWTRDRQPYISCFCCPPNVVRIIAEAGEYAYNLSQEGVWINLYGSNVLDTKLPGGDPVKLTQVTYYPWDGAVRIAIDEAPKEEMAVFLRIPGWSHGSAVKVNGQQIEKDLEPEQYFAVRRQWKAGDRIELTIPMEAHWIEAHPLVEETRGQAAVQRGPIVYCLESADLPADVRLENVSVQPTKKLRAHYKKDLLGGVTVLEGRARVVADGSWEQRLYRPVSPKKPAEIDLRLIPYYAWGNRGKTEMSVWLPVR